MHVVYIVIKLLTKPTHNKNTSYCPIVIDYENDTVLCHCTASRPGFMLYIRANSTLAFDNLDLFSPVNFTWKWKTMKFSAQLCRLPDVTDHLANRPTPVPKFFPKLRNLCSSWAIRATRRCRSNSSFSRAFSCSSSCCLEREAAISSLCPNVWKNFSLKSTLNPKLKQQRWHQDWATVR